MPSTIITSVHPPHPALGIEARTSKHAKQALVQTKTHPQPLALVFFKDTLLPRGIWSFIHLSLRFSLVLFGFSSPSSFPCATFIHVYDCIILFHFILLLPSKCFCRACIIWYIKVIISFFPNWFILCVWVLCLNMCLCATCGPSTCGVQNRASSFLELKL